jgi:hypothetical protein
VILRPCIICGTPSRGTRCPRHARLAEASRQGRQPYRAAYASPEYRRARSERLEFAGGRCEAVLPDGTRCPRPARETHHVVPLSVARDVAEALALCRVENLRAVCRVHNPRGGRR